MSVEDGCEVIVDTCMGVTPDDKAVIVTDKETMDIGKELRRQVLDKLPEQIEEEAEEATITFFVAQTVKGELDTVRMPFFNAGVQGGRHAHMMGLTKEILERGINVDYERIAGFTEKLHKRVQRAEEIRVKADNGIR